MKSSSLEYRGLEPWNRISATPRPGGDLRHIPTLSQLQFPPRENGDDKESFLFLRVERIKQVI